MGKSDTSCVVLTLGTLVAVPTDGYWNEPGIRVPVSIPVGYPGFQIPESPSTTHSASAVTLTPSEKNSINTDRKSPTRFSMSLRWSSYLAPKPHMGAQNRKTADLSSKIALCSKKVCYKVSLCENCQRQSCKAFIGLTNRAKMVGGGCPLLPEILGQSDRIGAK